MGREILFRKVRHGFMFCCHETPHQSTDILVRNITSSASHEAENLLWLDAATIKNLFILWVRLDRILENIRNH